MYIYEQGSGKLFHNDDYVDTGYAGCGIGLNNPQQDHMKNVGPLPRGLYMIGKAINGTHLGPLALPLFPEQHNTMKGRSAFFIHADNAKGNQSASTGCMVFSLATRKRIDEDTDKWLCVS
jgi:hypothetical protein